MDVDSQHALRGGAGDDTGLRALRPDHDFQNPTVVTGTPTPCSPSCFFLCGWISNLGGGLEGLGPVPQVPHASQLRLAARPRLLPKPVRGAACSLPCPHRHPPTPNKVSGPLSDAALPTPPISRPPLLPTFGSGKVAKCQRGHCSNKSSLGQHLQGPGLAPGRGRSPHPRAPSDKTPIVVGSEEDSFPLTKGLGSQVVDAGGDAWIPAGSLQHTLSSSLVHTFPLSWGSPKAFHSGFIFT